MMARSVWGEALQAMSTNRLRTGLTMLGMIIGVGAAWIVSRTAETTVVVTLQSILLAFTVAASVGIFYGDLWRKFG